MKKVSTLGLMFLGILTGQKVCASTTWSTSDSQILTGNSQIDCAEGICTFLPTDPTQEITSGLELNGITGITSFIFPENDGVNDYTLSTTDSIVFKFANTTINTVELNGDINSKGSAVAAIYINSNTIDNFIVNGDIQSQTLGISQSGTTTGALTINGDITAKEEGLKFNGTIGGDVTLNGIIHSTDDYGLYSYYGTWGGDLIINGELTTDISTALYFYYGNASAYQVINNGLISGNWTSIYVRRITLGGIINNATGIIESTQEDDGRAIDVYSSGNLKGIHNYGTINGDIRVRSGSQISNTINFYEGSVFNGKIINDDGIISSTTGAAIQYHGIEDNELTYTGSGTFSGLTYDIDMGYGNDTLNLVDASFSSSLDLNSVENLNVINTTFTISLTDTNKDSTLIDFSAINNLSFENSLISIITTDTVLESDLDGVFSLMQTGNGVDNLREIAVTLTGSTYNGAIQQVGNELQMIYGIGTLVFNGVDVESVDLSTTCVDGICITNLKDGIAVSSSKISIADIDDTDNVTDFIIQGETTDGAEDNVLLKYATTGNHIQIAGENYTNIINGADIHYLIDEDVHIIDFAANSILHGNFIQDGDIQALEGYYSSGIYLNNGVQILGNVTLNGNIKTEYGPTIYFGENSVITGDLTINGNLEGIYEVTEFYGLTVNGDMTINGNIIGESYGFDSNGLTVNGDLTINGDIIGLDNYQPALVFDSELNVGGDFILNGDIISDDSTTIINYANITGNFIINNINQGGNWSDGISLDNSTLAKDIVISEEAELHSYGTSYYAGLNISNTNINGNIINNGYISSQNMGINLTSDGSQFIGEVYNTGTIDTLHKGINVMGYDVQGVITNSGYIYAVDIWSNPDGGADGTYGIFLMEVNTVGIENTEVGYIEGQYGIGFGSQHYNGDKYGRAINDTDLTIHNDGEIVGSKYAAIAFDIGAIHGDAESFDNTLNYSGTGNLSGKTYSIEMGDGIDTVNITNAVINDLSINSAEIVNITDSTLGLTLINLNEQPLQNLNGTENLTLNNVVYTINAENAILTPNKYLILAKIDNIIVDLDELIMNIEGAQFETKGYFELVNDGEMDVLRYFVEYGGDGIIMPDQPAQTNAASLNTITLNSINTALSMTSSVFNVIENRQLNQAYLKTMKDVEFAAASTISSDINVVFSEMSNLKGGVWGQVFGVFDEYTGSASTGSVGSIGYTSSTYGLTIGKDHYFSSNILGGVAFTYMLGNIEGNQNSFTSDVSSMQLSSYGSYQKDQYFIDGIIGYGIGVYKQERTIGTTIASANYDNQQFSTQLSVGKVYSSTDFIITPFGKFNYINVTQSDYQETQSGMTLSVDAINFQSLQIGGGIELGYVMDVKGKNILPRVNVEYAIETLDSIVNSDSSILGSESAGIVNQTPDLGKNVFKIGVGVTYITDEGYQLSIDYQNETRDNYKSHSLFLKGKWMF